MAGKSIIDIEVKDEHFKRFQENFDRYQENLNRTPLTWRKVNLETFTMVESLKTVVQTLNQHSTVLSRIATGTNATAQATRQMADDWERAARGAQNVNQNVNGGGGGGGGGSGGGGTGGPGILGGFGAGMANQLGLQRMVSAGPSGVAFLVGKNLVAGIQSAISMNLSFMSSLAGMGGNLFGLDRLAMAGSAGLRSSRGLGIDYGGMKAAQNVFGAQFDANRVMEGISTGRGDITSDQFKTMAILGIGGGNTGDQMSQMRERFREFALNTPEELLGPLMQAYGYDKFFSIQDARRFKEQPLHEFNQDTEMQKRQAQLAQVNPQDLRMWQEFNLTLKGAQNTIESSLIRGLAPLAPELTKISEALSEAISSLLGSQGFRDIIDIVTNGLRSFANYVKSDDFRQDIVAFGNALRSFAATIKGIIDWWNGKPGEVTVDSDGTVRSSSGVAVGVRSTTGQLLDYEGRPISASNVDAQGNLIATGPGSAAAGGAGTSATVGVTGTQTTVQAVSDPRYAQYIQHLMGKGWSYDQAIGMVANIHEESGGNPNLPGDKGTAWGLAQWRGSRQADFKRLFNKDIKNSTWQEQLDFMDWELRNTHQVFRPGESMTSKTAHEKFIRGFEKPEAGHMAARIAGNTAEQMERTHQRGMMVPTRITVDNLNPSSINVQTNSVWQAI